MNVCVDIHSVQRADGETEQYDVVATGEWEYSPHKAVLRYAEAVDGGMEETVTTLSFENDRCILTRAGAWNSRLLLEKGETHLCDYHTPFGEWKMEISASAVKGELSECGGQIHLAYTLKYGDMMSTEHEIHITVKGSP